jgi:hypothetical protein
MVVGIMSGNPTECRVAIKECQPIILEFVHEVGLPDRDMVVIMGDYSDRNCHEHCCDKKKWVKLS